MDKRLGCRGNGADELKEHPFFEGIDWNVVYQQKYPPPLIPPRGEVNAADAFDIGSFDEEDTKGILSFDQIYLRVFIQFFFSGIKLTEADQELYKNFPLVISERWQAEVADTVFYTINHDFDKVDTKKRAKQKKFLTTADEKDSDCILHGYLRKQGGPFGTNWQTRYAKLYPNRLELHAESSKPELTFMDQIEEITNDLVQVKNEQCIVMRTKNDTKMVLTSNDEIGLKEWSSSLRAAHKCSFELLSSLAKKAGKIYGTAESGNASAAVASSSNTFSSSTPSSAN